MINYCWHLLEYFSNYGVILEHFCVMLFFKECKLRWKEFSVLHFTLYENLVLHVYASVL